MRKNVEYLTTVPADYVPGATVPRPGGTGGSSTTTIINVIEDTDVIDGSVGATFDGGGFVIEVGALGSMSVQNTRTIVAWTILFRPGVTDSIQFDVWKSNFFNYPTISAANSIVGANPPLVSGANQANSTTLAGWITTINAGDRLVFSCTSRGTPVWAELTLFTKLTI